MVRLPARSAWRSVTAEPERELPAAVATLRAGGPPDPAAVERERALLEQIVVRGTERRWLAYLSQAVDLLARTPRAPADLAVARAREIVLDVVRNHHALLLGLPGRAAERTAAERERLERLDTPSESEEP
jgi:hypothetical protein